MGEEDVYPSNGDNRDIALFALREVLKLNREWFGAIRRIGLELYRLGYERGRRVRP